MLACFLLFFGQSIARRLRNSSAGTAVFLQKAPRPCGPRGSAPTHARFRRNSSENRRRDVLGIFSEPALHRPTNPSLCGRRKGDYGGSRLPFPEAQAGTGIDTNAADTSPAHRTKAGRGETPHRAGRAACRKLPLGAQSRFPCCGRHGSRQWEGGLLHNPSFPQPKPRFGVNPRPHSPGRILLSSRRAATGKAATGHCRFSFLAREPFSWALKQSCVRHPFSAPAV